MINILILDNSITMFNILKEQLTEGNSKYTFTHLSEFDKAEKNITEKEIDLIILSKGTEGITFIKKMNESELYKNIPIILTTTDMEDPNINDIKISGLLKKPCSKEQVVKIVKKALIKSM